MPQKIKAVIFDWGDTLMHDFPQFEGPMAYWDKVEIIPGVEAALKRLSQYYKCCVASNAGDSSTKMMELALHRVGIDAYFKQLFTSNELGASKPDPKFFNQIVQRLKLESNVCVFVGNDYEKDIVPAKQVGFHTVLFLENDRGGLYTEADCLIQSMNELYDVLVNLNNHTRKF